MSDKLSKINLANFEKLLNYKFKSNALLIKALTHSSYYNQNKADNSNHFQRLEFLGDSIINLVTSEYLFKKFPFFSEGKLSKLKAAMICQSYLVKLANTVQLEKYVIIGKSVDLNRGRGKFSILSDCIESCIGAIFLDSNYCTVKKVIKKLIAKVEANKLTVDQGDVSKDFKSLLQEITQKNMDCLPEYLLVKEEGSEHKKLFTIEVRINGQIYGNGIGKNKKEAEQNAASQALKKMGKHFN
ncbi:MAG: ribonuclease III [Atribacterota bacterium]|nr:ribonuclease III [Atribacterota bacterium]